MKISPIYPTYYYTQIRKRICQWCIPPFPKKFKNCPRCGKYIKSK